MPTVLMYRTRTVTTKVSYKVCCTRNNSMLNRRLCVEQPPLELYMEVNGDVVLVTLSRVAAASGMSRLMRCVLLLLLRKFVLRDSAREIKCKRGNKHSHPRCVCVTVCVL